MTSMLLSLLLVSNILASYTQTLVFGNEMKNGIKSHYCDYNLSPHAFVDNVTIFRVVDGNQDRAVAHSTIRPYARKDLPKYFRIDIPSDLVGNNNEYSFQFELINGDEVFSESWAFDSRKDCFSLVSAIQRRPLDDPNTRVIIIACALVASTGIVYYFYKRYRRSKATM